LRPWRNEILFLLKKEQTLITKILLRNHPSWKHSTVTALLLRTCLVASLVAAFFGVTPLFAGPPFATDDPEPVAYRNGEFYIGSQYENDRDGASGTAPHVEVNYGVAPDVQLHLIVPNVFDRPRGGPTLLGSGDIELGIKYRFMQEGRYRPMAAIFPLLHLPTGDRNRGLGNGDPQLFFPLWLQKSLGPWTTYGGGGYWLNPGTGNKNYWFIGWLLQRDITKWLTVGGEVFRQSPSTTDGKYQTGYNLGSIINFTDNHHLIFSAGSDVRGPGLFRSYVAYLFTWGPPGERK
jgi:hypothetical protein